MMTEHDPARGFTLVELMVSLSLSTTLVLGVVQLAQATAGSHRLQQNLASLQENARFALGMIGRQARQAGYRPEPWLPEAVTPAISATASDQATPRGDLIAFTRWSNRNCYANRNPVTDVLGRPRYWLLESEFRVTEGGNLAYTCRYGPDPASLTTQVNRLGLVQNVEAMHALYAEDSDGDGNADRWVNAGGWQSEHGVMGAEVAILLSSPGQFGRDAAGAIELLDATLTAPDDGRLRHVVRATFAIRGRSG